MCEVISNRYFCFCISDHIQFVLFVQIVLQLSGFSFSFKQKKSKTKSLENQTISGNLDLFSKKMTDSQRHLFSNKLSELPEMSKYSQGTESYPQFAVRIAEMLQDPAQFKELYPYLKKVGYMPSNKKDTVNG